MPKCKEHFVDDFVLHSPKRGCGIAWYVCKRCGYTISVQGYGYYKYTKKRTRKEAILDMELVKKLKANNVRPNKIALLREYAIAEDISLKKAVKLLFPSLRRYL